MTYAIEAQPLWQPNPQTVGQTRMAQFMRAEGYESYADLWQWSIDMPEVFWSSLWNYCGVVGEKGTKILADRDLMPGARWFPEARPELRREPAAATRCRRSAGLLGRGQGQAQDES